MQVAPVRAKEHTNSTLDITTSGRGGAASSAGAQTGNRHPRQGRHFPEVTVILLGFNFQHNLFRCRRVHMPEDGGDDSLSREYLFALGLVLGGLISAVSFAVFGRCLLNRCVEGGKVLYIYYKVSPIHAGRHTANDRRKNLVCFLVVRLYDVGIGSVG
jgi:hypothetical protein